MEQKASVGTEEEGNTVTSSSLKSKKQQPVRRKYYCGSMFNYETVGIEGIETRLREVCERYQFGYETCPTTGRPHLQLFMVLKKPMRITELKIPCNPHLESCNGDEESNLRYTSKEGKVVRWGYPKDIRIISELRPWQKEIENLVLGEPDERTIHWFWEETGNIGKSALVKYLVVKYNCLFCQGGKESDIMNLVFKSDMDKSNCVLFDIPRSHKGNVSYSALENIKNGLVCNTKYETGYKVFNSPHVICFANYPPAKPEELSSDRWKVKYLGTQYDEEGVFIGECG